MRHLLASVIGLFLAAAPSAVFSVGTKLVTPVVLLARARKLDYTCR